jgi:AcrR family transcriptional regulator
VKASAKKKAIETDVSLLEAARTTLQQKGYSGFSTREVASTAGVPLSQIHYHFGSKQGLLLALFEYLNAQLLERQSALFDNRMLSLSERWDRACDYLDDDIGSGYVRILQELVAASWVDPAVARIVRAGMIGWFDLLVEVARNAEREFGSLGPFKPEDIGSLIGNAFMGAESMHLLGLDKAGVPIRQALRKVGDLIRTLENRPKARGK